MDYVVDIESNFYFPDKDSYFREVYEVLKDDGVFFVTILNFRTHMEDIHHIIKRYFHIVREVDITENA